MRILKRLAVHFSKSNLEFMVVRISRDGHHHYSILASRNGFEYVFRNGHDHWSTISPSFARRILERNKEEISSRTTSMTAKDYVKIAFLGESWGWEKSNVIFYLNREEALRVERDVLDKSWANAEGEYDGI